MAAACDKMRRARPLLGTFVEIEATAAPGDASVAIDAAFAAIADVHRLMSFHDADSDVGRLNREAAVRLVEVHAWTYEVLSAAVELQATSDGAFDITVAPALQAMGLLPWHEGDDAETDQGRSHVLSQGRLSDPIELLPGNRVRFRAPSVRIDLGGIAKGYAVDRALAALRHFGVKGGMVNAGGDLAAFGSERQTVQVRDPRAPQRLICGIAVGDEALASSARRFDPFESAATSATAIIDPASGQPTEQLHGATVRAPSCMIADALTKIVMIRGTDAGDVLQRYDAGALLIAGDGDIQITPNLHQAVHLAA